MKPKSIHHTVRESELQNACRYDLPALGFPFVFHIPAKAYQLGILPAGFPDVVAFGRGRLLLAELKSETGKIKPEQQALADLLGTRPAALVRIVRPSDYQHWLADVRALQEGN